MACYPSLSHFVLSEQELVKHVSELKEGRDSVANEVFIALHNDGENEAKERCAAVLHPVRVWHGR